MKRDSDHNFAMSDGMVLIAAIAVGIAGGRARLTRETMPFAWWGIGFQDRSAWMAVSLSLALVVIGLRWPRPPLRRLAARPGWMAAVAVAVTLALVCVDKAEMILLLLSMKSGLPSSGDLIQEIGDRMMTTPSFAVAGAWAALAIGRRWRPGRRWSDRLGFALGFYWIAFGTVTWIGVAMPTLLVWFKVR